MMMNEAPAILTYDCLPPFARRAAIRDGYVVLQRYTSSWTNGIGSERCWKLDTVAVVKLTKKGDVPNRYLGGIRSDVEEAVSAWRAAGKPAELSVIAR